MNKEEILNQLQKEKFFVKDMQGFFEYNYDILNSLWEKLMNKDNRTDEENEIIIALDCMLSFIEYIN